jgi:hypothetical protein
MSDGITCHALRRAATASASRPTSTPRTSATTTRNATPTTSRASRPRAAGARPTPTIRSWLKARSPPTLIELALAAPVLAALERSGCAGPTVIELCAPHAVLAAVTRGSPTDRRTSSRRPGSRSRRGSDAAERSGLLGQRASPRRRVGLRARRRGAAGGAAGWTLVASSRSRSRRPGLARLASRPRWRRRLLYSTVRASRRLARGVPRWLLRR